MALAWGVVVKLSVAPMIVDDLVHRLQRKEAEVADLRRQVELRQSQRLASLHIELGFGSAEELVAALLSASGVSGSRVSGSRVSAGRASASRASASRAPVVRASVGRPPLSREAKPAGPVKAPRLQGTAAANSGRRSKRARISPEMRQSIESALLAGEPGAAVARRFGISYPTLHKIKTATGLVTKRPR